LRAFYHAIVFCEIELFHGAVEGIFQRVAFKTTVIADDD
jgi:hypothetical protein